MTRTTNANLQAVVDLINARTHNRFNYSIDHAYGGVRLVRKGGSVDVSPRLTKGELLMWMHAFYDGIDVGSEAVLTR